MKSMWSPLAAIFFMTYFHRATGGPWPPRAPLDPLLLVVVRKVSKATLFFLLVTDFSTGMFKGCEYATTIYFSQIMGCVGFSFNVAIALREHLSLALNTIQPICCNKKITVAIVPCEQP